MKAYRVLIGTFAFAMLNAQAAAQGNLLPTRNGNGLGLALSNYKYKGTDEYNEVRGFVGYDFLSGRHALSSYVGLRAASTTGAAGYRESNYYMLPVGLNHRTRLRGDALLSTTLEYDYLMRGRLETTLTDLIGYAGYTGSVQRHGYGWRLSSMYQFRNWSVGPYLLTWRIGQSDNDYVTATQSGVTRSLQAWEPQNSTQEVGLKGAYRF